MNRYNHTKYGGMPNYMSSKLFGLHAYTKHKHMHACRQAHMHSCTHACTSAHTQNTHLHTKQTHTYRNTQNIFLHTRMHICTYTKHTLTHKTNPHTHRNTQNIFLHAPGDISCISTSFDVNILDRAAQHWNSLGETILMVLYQTTR